MRRTEPKGRARSGVPRSAETGRCETAELSALEKENIELKKQLAEKMLELDFLRKQVAAKQKPSGPDVGHDSRSGRKKRGAKP
ncbi:hypothetical protein [Bradyrhizobium sp. WSM3983]|uniref:hypothetical protein n=1 Tax=Bradyrhizobium sp. WSM3983 TaxID=1038867 RepID=UPI00041E721D|nr:hypothetical protein [Bradyrhizobium sp. WSM3983]